MELRWDKHAWEDYLFWQKTDKKVLNRLNKLIKDTLRNPNQGLGKPEKLKGDFSGYSSRRISNEHRLVYKVYEDRVHILLCRFHY